MQASFSTRLVLLTVMKSFLSFEGKNPICFWPWLLKSLTCACCPPSCLLYLLTPSLVPEKNMRRYLKLHGLQERRLKMAGLRQGFTTLVTFVLFSPLTMHMSLRSICWPYTVLLGKTKVQLCAGSWGRIVQGLPESLFVLFFCEERGSVSDGDSRVLAWSLTKKGTLKARWFINLDSLW